MNAIGVMTYKGFTARLGCDAADGMYVGHVTGIKGVVAFHSDTETGPQTARETVDDYVVTW
jgi:predicted HicB family RNase H-like nuclease